MESRRIVRLEGTSAEFECSETQSILDGAEQAGLVLPYSCRKGVCTTCAAPLRAGAVRAGDGTIVEAPADQVLLCQARPCADVEIAPRRLRRREPPARRTIESDVVSVRWLAPAVAELRLRFPVGRRVRFAPGQYLRVLLGDESRNYSLANAPQNCDGAIIHVRHIPGGHFSDGHLRTLARGATLTVELPFGEMTPSSDPRPLLVMVTGTGVAPALSIITDRIRRADARPLHLYWGGRREEDLYCAGRLTRWASTYPWLSFTPVLSKPDPDWRGATGWVQDAALADRGSLDGLQVVACGSAAMVDAAREACVAQRDLPEEDFLADPFVATGNAGTS